MKSYKKLLSHNKNWAKEKVEKDPEYFTRLVDTQTPEFLYIGCSDSRVPSNEITGTEPGELFVHRNVANLVVPDDLNMLSVLQYAVEVLKVKHVIVCGHYGCGGIRAAMAEQDFGIIDLWLKNIKNVYHYHKKELENLHNEDQCLNRLTELNIQEQVMNLARTSIIQNAWKTDNRPDLHGWVYDLHDGVIKPLLEVPAGTVINNL